MWLYRVWCLIVCVGRLWFLGLCLFIVCCVYVVCDVGFDSHALVIVLVGSFGFGYSIGVFGLICCLFVGCCLLVFVVCWMCGCLDLFATILDFACMHCCCLCGDDFVIYCFVWYSWICLGDVGLCVYCVCLMCDLFGVFVAGLWFVFYCLLDWCWGYACWLSCLWFDKVVTWLWFGWLFCFVFSACFGWFACIVIGLYCGFMFVNLICFVAMISLWFAFVIFEFIVICSCSGVLSLMHLLVRLPWLGCCG